MAEDHDREQRRKWFLSLKRASVVTVLTTIFLVTVYGAGVYALTRSTGNAGASPGPVGKPCSADNGHPFKHGHAATCSSSTTSIGSTSIPGTTSIGTTSIPGTTSVSTGG
jgi:hypothetical protein